MTNASDADELFACVQTSIIYERTTIEWFLYSLPCGGGERKLHISTLAPQTLLAHGVAVSGHGRI